MEKYEMKNNNNEVLTPSNKKLYDYVDKFCEGLAWFVIGGKAGFIDEQGNEVVPLKYDRAYHFIDGLARVQLNGKWGAIDKQGNEVIPFIYEHGEINEQLPLYKYLIVKIDKWKNMKKE